MIHLFNTEIAEKYGIEKAILIHNFVYWIEKNKANNTHFIEGKYWTYNSAKAFSELFPYMGSERKIYRLLAELVEEGVLETANHNTDKRNQTKWYAIVDKSIFQVYQMQMTEMPNASDTSVQLHSPDLSNANTENGNSHSPNLSNEYKETDNKQQIVNLQIGESNSKLEITREEKNSHTQNSENENLAKSENNFSVDNFVDEKNQHTPTQENQKQSRYVREYFWMTASDKSKLEDDYFKSEIDDYVDRYNSWVKTSGNQSRCPVETIRKWMLEDGARKRPSKEQRRLDEIVRLANFPRWEWESDESFYERIRRYDKAGLPPHYNGTIRKWKDAEVKAQAIQIDRAVRAEYFGENF